MQRTGPPPRLAKHFSLSKRCLVALWHRCLELSRVRFFLPWRDNSSSDWVCAQRPSQDSWGRLNAPRRVFAPRRKIPSKPRDMEECHAQRPTLITTPQGVTTNVHIKLPTNLTMQETRSASRCCRIAEASRTSLDFPHAGIFAQRAEA